MCTAVFWRFFCKNPFSEVTNIRQTSKIYPQVAQMFLYKIRESKGNRATFSKFFWHPQQSRQPLVLILGFLKKRLKSIKKIEKIHFLKIKSRAPKRAFRGGVLCFFALENPKRTIFANPLSSGYFYKMSRWEFFFMLYDNILICAYAS